MRRSIITVYGVAEGARAPGGSTGRQLRTFRVTARLVAGLHPRLTNARRWDFQNAVTAHPVRRLARPAVLWDMVDEAAVTVECAACDAAAAAETVQAVIRHAAEADAGIGVREIKIVKISPAGGYAPVPGLAALTAGCSCG